MSVDLECCACINFDKMSKKYMDKSVGKETDTTAANEPTSPAVTAAVGTTTTLSGAPSTERLSTVDVSPPQMTPAAEGIHRCIVRTRYHRVKDCSTLFVFASLFSSCLRLRHGCCSQIACHIRLASAVLQIYAESFLTGYMCTSSSVVMHL